MNRKDVLRILKKHKNQLTGLGVRSLSVFGSVARDQAGLQSDVDLLVEFSETPNFDRFMDVKIFLEDILGNRVDLVMQQPLRPEIRPFIEKDLLHVT